jgi:(p)ppGpp synthase/HD superfamily hydrolase
VSTLKDLQNKFPELRKVSPDSINRKIYSRLKLYIDDDDLHAAALIQNPFKKTKELQPIQEKYNIKVRRYIEKLNELFDVNPDYQKNIKNNQRALILFLLNCGELFNNKETHSHLLTKKRIAYAMDLLQKIEIGELRVALEDIFFEYLEPEMYGHYQSLLKFSKKRYHEMQKQISRYFSDVLKQNNINAKILGRVKTIRSIHNKVSQKNILLSQVLDTIGLRVIVPNVNDCYQTMGIILKNYPIMTCRVKDYISIPKNNGYQSIHLTIMHEGHPTEIQIRTAQMHKFAQYGKACHLTYKKYATST